MPRSNTVESRASAERDALAMELHDTVVQPLTSLLTSLRCMEGLPQYADYVDANVALWKALAQEALDALRRTLAGVHAHPHAQTSLPEALERFLTPQFRGRGMRLSVESHNWPAGLPVEWTSNLYLLAREVVNNAEKHAHASRVKIVLRAEPAELFVSVTDNGVGFNPDDLFAASCAQERLGSGLGIGGMRDRIRSLNGELDLITAPGCGVRLEIRAPNPMKPVPKQRSRRNNVQRA
jgi:signal transduction histidine kinase